VAPSGALHRHPDRADGQAHAEPVRARGSKRLTDALAASGRELRRFNEIALGLVFLALALICQFTSVTNTHIGR
jgi:hypothetical protein